MTNFHDLKLRLIINFELPQKITPKVQKNSAVKFYFRFVANLYTSLGVKLLKQSIYRNEFCINYNFSFSTSV